MFDIRGSAFKAWAAVFITLPTSETVVSAETSLPSYRLASNREKVIMSEFKVYSVVLIGPAGSQGSKKAFVRKDALHRVKRVFDEKGDKVNIPDIKGAIGKGQKGVAMIESSSDGGDFRRALIIAMRERGPVKPFDEAVCVALKVYVRRLKKDLDEWGYAKSTAPRFPKNGLDLDKVQRAVGDAGFYAGWWENDNRIAQWKSERLFADEGPIRVEIMAWSLEEEAKLSDPVAVKKAQPLPLFS